LPPPRTNIATVTLAEVFARAYKPSQVNRLLALIAGLLREVQIIDFDSVCAEKFGQVPGALRPQEASNPTAELMNALAALVPNLTLATHNALDFRCIPGLRLDDWINP
jgi:tRNA(fMet)-specific endonuclease VapC